MAQGRIWSIRTSYGYDFKDYMRWEIPESIAVSPGPVPGALPAQAAALPCTRVKLHGRDRGDQAMAMSARLVAHADATKSEISPSQSCSMSRVDSPTLESLESSGLIHPSPAWRNTRGTTSSPRIPLCWQISRRIWC